MATRPLIGMQILACAIVVTVLLGCAKLGHTHYNLRKYSAIAEKDKQEEQAMHRQMSHRRRPPTTTDVPFGIRAIESGVEVEGVWISRNNSPEPASTRDTSTASMWDAAVHQRHEIDLEKQDADTRHGRHGLESTNASNPATNAGMAGTRMTSHGQPEGVMSKPAKNKQHPPLSYAKYSGNPSLFNQAPYVSTIEGINAIHRASGPVTTGSTHGDEYGSRDSSQSTSDGTDTEPISSSAPNLLGRRQKQQSMELDLMHSHRLSQAAETGQLTPRVRRTETRGDSASFSYEHRASSVSDSGDRHQHVRARSESPVARPATLIGCSSDMSLRPPSLDSLPAAASRTSLPDVTPFAQFCRTAPILLRPESRQSVASTASKSAMQQAGDSLEQYMSRSSNFEAQSQRAAPPIETAVAAQKAVPEAPAQALPEQRTSFEHRKSVVVRGHGSGFEILRPGTFAEQSAEKQRSAPPISLYNSSSSSRHGSSSTDGRRKIQKKRPPSVGSETSSSGGGSRDSGRWSLRSLA